MHCSSIQRLSWEMLYFFMFLYLRSICFDKFETKQKPWIRSKKKSYFQKKRGNMKQNKVQSWFIAAELQQILFYYTHKHLLPIQCFTLYIYGFSLFLYNFLTIGMMTMAGDPKHLSISFSLPLLAYFVLFERCSCALTLPLTIKIRFKKRKKIKQKNVPFKRAYIALVQFHFYVFINNI